MPSPLHKRPVIIVLFLLALIGAGAILVFSLLEYAPSDPLVGSDQLVLVLAKTHSSTQATLQVFDRVDGGWKFAFACPAVIGGGGMGWGRGLHKSKDMQEGEPVKEEGDGRSPEGAFPLIAAFGKQPPSMVSIKFPYTQTTECLICVDDPRSRHYNEIIDYCREGLDREKLPSHETMLREDNLYDYVIVVGHNSWKPEPGKGSCIFIHLWGGPDSTTAGCTAVSEENMLTLLSLLDSSKKPVMVSLVRKTYFRLRETWGLPDVSI